MMNKSLCLAVCAVILGSPSPSRAQYLDRPESVVYDLVRNRHLVSNYGDGSIIIIDQDGFQSPLTSGRSSSAGLHIIGNTVYVGCGDGVAGYDLETGAETMWVTIPGSELLNDVTADTSGYLYVSDPYADKVFRIRLSDLSYSTLVEYIIWPNGVLFDEENNRLLVCTSTTQNLYAVDLLDGTLTLLVHVGLGHLDGLAEDNAGNIYVSAQGVDAVYRYPPDLSGVPTMVSSGHAAPADIYFNKRQHLLCVPNIGGSNVDFVPIAVPQWTPVTAGPVVSDGGSTQGVSWADYDGDGFQDLFMANMFSPAGQNNWLYRNNRNATFTRVDIGDIVQDGGTSGTSTWGDCDNDGNLDCFVANTGASQDFLYLGVGDGTFTKVTTGPIVAESESSTAASWADYDGDGLLDLFVSHTGPNSLFRNEGTSFTQIITGDIVTDNETSHGAAWADYDNDHDLDLFVANANGEDNSLYRNDGGAGFTKITGLPIVTGGGASCGGSWGDYNNDGHLDLFVANASSHPDSTNFLYRNNGDGSFTRVTGGVVANDEGRSVGSAWGDYDNDADLDLVVITYGAGDYGQAVLYQNQFGLFFQRVNDEELAADSGGLYGAAWGDYDRDGDIDLAVARARDDNEDNLLFRNNGNGNNWITIRCIGTTSNRSAIGARIRVLANIDGAPVRQLREITAQTGCGGQNSLEVHFGLGRAGDIDSLTVEWPSGITEAAAAVPVNRHLILSEGEMDPDGDGQIGNLDNCPSHYNPGQEDIDGDRVGDVCECACPCHGDPQCEGETNVLDVVKAVNVAFRSNTPVTDPDCPNEQTDVSCDGVTNVIDVVKFVNVAFRSGDPGIEFCQPCAPSQ